MDNDNFTETKLKSVSDNQYYGYWGKKESNGEITWTAHKMTKETMLYWNDDYAHQFKTD